MARGPRVTRVDIGPWGETIAEFAEACVAAEQAGFHTAWATELHRTPFVPLAAAASRTNRIGLGSGIALAFVRSPLTTALTALDMSDLSDGRFALGLGTGVARLNERWHNVPFDNPVARARETISMIRQLMAGVHEGAPIAIEGEHQRIHLSNYERPFPPRHPPAPIFLGSVGPAMSALAGEVADGWIGHELGSPRYLAERVLPAIHRGLERAGRKREDIKLIASSACVIHEDSHTALREMAGLVAFYASVRTYTDFFAFHGFEREAQDVQARFREGDIEGMVDACPDEMVAALSIAGTPDEVRRKVDEYGEIVDAIKVTPPTHHTDPEVTRHAQRSILEHFAR